MKKIFNVFSMILVGMLFLTACQDDDHELGVILDKSQINFEVEQIYDIDEGGNTVLLRNLTPETVAMWDYGTGRSTRTTDTIRFPFKGEYTIKFSALTAGGVVPMEPVIIEVTEDNLMYVSDPLWLALSGGPGEEKSWVLDMDAKYFDGPMYFYGTDNGWLLEGGPWSDGAQKTGCYGDDCWNWSPVYADNTWLMPDGDYGVMTFSLDGGPYFSASKPMEGGIEEEGTYYLDVNSKTLTINDASILRGYKGDNAGIAGISDWSNYTVLSLDENTLQLGVIRDNDIDGEGLAMLVYNFVSKEYSDNWVPDEPAGDPNFDHGDQSQILAVNTSKTWYLDLEVPYNWASLEGEMLNNWNSRADIMATGWAPYGDADVENIDNASIEFAVDGKVIVTQDDGTTEEGTYSINEKTNMISFSGITPSIPIAGWVTAATTSDNKWKIVKIEETIAGEITGIWLGQRAVDKDEYMVFHFVQR